MLRQKKPFVTVYKGGNKNRRFLQSFDPEDIFAGDEKKPVDISQDFSNDDGYESVLKAADALFKPKQAYADSFFTKPQPTVEQPPAPRILADLSARDELSDRLASAEKPRKRSVKINLPGQMLPASDARLHRQLATAALTIKTKAVLDQLELRFVGDLVQQTEAGLNDQELGYRTIKEISDFLALDGLSLNTVVSNWPPHGLAAAQADLVEPVLVEKVQPRVQIKPVAPVLVQVPNLDIQQVQQLLLSRSKVVKKIKPGEKWKIRRHFRR